MRQSHLFTKTRKEAPKDEVSKNAQLLIRAGFVHKEMAGVYSFLPLGLRTLNKICGIIREEMNAIGGQELQLTALQDKKVWEASGRWDDAIVDTWFKTKLQNDTELGLGFTHEEPLTQLMKSYIRSANDLPVYAYQIQTKFRNERRAKSGIMRGREFLMKDLYSFSRTAEEHAAFYEKSKEAYMNIFRRVGLGDRTFITFATGGSFAKYSHEFQTVSDAGEDIIYIDEKKKVAINKEIMDDKASADQIMVELGVERGSLVEKKAVEVGNIFSLGTRFSVPLELNYLDASGKNNPVIMGSYGIGPSRLMGVVAELLSDEKGIVWPKAVAPFSVHLVVLFDKEGKAGKVAAAADKLYSDLTAAGIDVLYDDRDQRPGEKFADSDLIGIPTRIVISEKTLAATGGESVEIKDRKTGIVSIIPLEKVKIVCSETK